MYDELESKIEQPERDGLLTPPCTPLMGAADAESLGRVVVLYVGRVSWEKNLMLLLRALMVLQNTLPKGFPTIKAVFVGDGPARQELENICREHGIDATFMGQVVGEKLAECYASADVFCFPSFTEVSGRGTLIKRAAVADDFAVGRGIDIRSSRPRSLGIWTCECIPDPTMLCPNH